MSEADYPQQAMGIVKRHFGDRRNIIPASVVVLMSIHCVVVYFPWISCVVENLLLFISDSFLPSMNRNRWNINIWGCFDLLKQKKGHVKEHESFIFLIYLYAKFHQQKQKSRRTRSDSSLVSVTISLFSSIF